MKKVAQALVTIAVLIFGYQAYIDNFSPCQRVLKYSIGRFDQNFAVNKSDFISKIEKAENPWEKALGRNIFQYDPNGSFKVNLIYDERQRDLLLKQSTESGLSQAELEFKSLDSKFAQFKAQYEEHSAAYESALTVNEERAALYQSEVKYWNSRGGAPKEEYNKLSQEREELNASVAELNNEAATLNAAASELKSLLSSRNAAAEKYNQLVQNYNAKFGGGLEFNQAEYTGKEINLYEFSNNLDLLWALSHELGHWLGLGHVDNPKSIMYYLTTDQRISTTPVPSKEDGAELNLACKSSLPSLRQFLPKGFNIPSFNLI